jgi:endonuclease/exonuclease/phosphatase (EEP) superfamily protein YafD
MAVLLSVICLGVQLPLFVGDSPPADTVAIRIMTANVYLGQADADGIVATATANADLLAVQELTSEEADRMSKAGVDRTFPFHALDTRDYASGVGLWSRYPIVESHRVSGYKLAMVSARIRVDGVMANPTLIVGHLSGPWPQPIDNWINELGSLRRTMQSSSELGDGGCVAIAGDFNATLDMRPFRRLLSGGYRDAAEQAGASLTPTYPANSWVPPFMAIDHVLTSGCQATSAEVAGLPGSDHRALLVTVDVPRNR